MSSSQTETAVRPPSDEPKKTSLSPAQVAASALAAVSSAVVASFFGVAGTLIGAALASVITTVSASLYATSLRKTNERLRQVLTAGQRPTRNAVATTRALPAHLDPRRAPAMPFRPRWGRVAVYAVSVFVVAMAIVTGIELIGQKPVSALVGHSSTSGTTTLGELANTSSSSDTTPTTPSSPTTTAPATSTAQRSSAAPTSASASTSTSDSQEATPSRSSSSSSASSASSSSSASSARTASSTSSPAPAQGTAATPTP